MNYLSNADRFLTLWDDPSQIRIAGPSVPPRAPNKPCSIYPPAHPSFKLSLEPRVRTLVLGLLSRLRCVTYSSCGGHRATSTRAFQPLHVGILPRNETEHHAILERMQRAARTISKSPEARPYRILVREDRVESQSGARACIDLYIEPRSISEDAYFRGLPSITSRFLSGIKETMPVVELSWPSPSKLGELRNTLRTAKPYPYILLPQLLSADAIRHICTDIDTLPRTRVERQTDQYQAIDIVATAAPRHSALKALIADLGSPGSCRFLSALTGMAGLSLDCAHVRWMHHGDNVAPHFDAGGHDGCYRLFITLASRRASQGGAHLILRERKRDFVVEDVIRPRAGQGLLFLINGNSSYAVSSVTGRVPHLSLVATFCPKS